MEFVQKLEGILERISILHFHLCVIDLCLRSRSNHIALLRREVVFVGLANRVRVRVRHIR